MNTPDDLSLQVAALRRDNDFLHRALRWLFALLLFAIAAVCLRSAFQIPNYRAIYADMVSDPSTLPGLSRFVLDHPALFQLSALLLPLIGFAALFGLRHRPQAGILTALIIGGLLLAQAVLVSDALMSPLGHILTLIGGTVP